MLPLGTSSLGLAGPLTLTLNRMKKIPSVILFIILIFPFCSFGRESKNEIFKYSGDGTIQYLPAPGLFGRDGIEIKFENFDLSKNYTAKYSLQNLPVGNPYMVYFVVPDPAPLDEIKKNTLKLKILSNNKVVNDINIQIGKMINNQGKSLNRFYCLSGFHNLHVTSQVVAETGSNISIEFSYMNENVVKKTYGYLLLERGGFK